MNTSKEALPSLQVGLNSIALVIPYFNEINRFETHSLVELSTAGRDILDIYLIDDGSTDTLSKTIAEIVSKKSLTNVYQLASKQNLGKANAIRLGYNLIMDMRKNYSYFAFTDADFSTPPREILRVAKFATKCDSNFVYGARIRINGNSIRTSKFRSTQGKIFTLIVKFLLQAPFKDSQCGLKFLKINDVTNQVFSEPFINSWLVDLEILCRAMSAKEVSVTELVLREWTHYEKSKTGIKDIPKVAGALLKLRFKYGSLSKLRVESAS